MHVVKAKTKRMTGLEFMSVNDETVEIKYVPARLQHALKAELEAGSDVSPWVDNGRYWKSIMIHPRCIPEFIKLIGIDFVYDEAGVDSMDPESY